VCNAAGRVAVINVNQLGLSGGLCGSSLSQLSALTYLSLYGNNLTGTLGDSSSSFLASLTALTYLCEFVVARIRVLCGLKVIPTAHLIHDYMHTQH
jgi:hypothetical protein